MIELKKLFTPVAAMDATETKAYMDSHPEGSYLILDVRQPWEYEESHIPGAKLLPLPQLTDAYKQLDPEKPTIVHCAIGGRSRVAAQMLSGLGFKEVYNLAGGIKAYQGAKAAGPQELNLELVRGDETPPEIIRLAFAMELGLQTFYETLQGKTGDQDLADLFGRLAQVEVRHEQRLKELYAQEEAGTQGPEPLDAEKSLGLLEGGFKFQEFLEQNAPHLQTAPQVLELAMMLETQALDLYLRFADRCRQARTREVLFAIGQEEKAHLKSLGRLLEEKVRQGGAA